MRVDGEQFGQLADPNVLSERQRKWYGQLLGRRKRDRCGQDRNDKCHGCGRLGGSYRHAAGAKSFADAYRCTFSNTYRRSVPDPDRCAVSDANRTADADAGKCDRYLHRWSGCYS